MRVVDLLDVPGIDIRIRVTGSPGATDRAVQWCAPTESIDPSPFLTPGALMITSGMALNFTDARIWNAYVERLADIPVAALAFGIGPAHSALPDGLALACENYGVPLLEISPDVPFVHVLRAAQDMLVAERYAATRMGSALAEEGARIAASGGTLGDVLQRISSDIDCYIAIEDSTGAVLLSAGSGEGRPNRAEFSMPGSDHNRFRLVVHQAGYMNSLRTVIAPVAAVVSMQLSTTLGSNAVAFSRNAGRLMESIYGPDPVLAAELVTLVRDAELEPYDRIGLVVLERDAAATVTYLRSVSWRLRVMLAGQHPVMRYVEEPDLSTILLQGGELGSSALLNETRAMLADLAGVSVVTATAENAAELELVLRLARRSLGEPGVRSAPPLTFSAVIDSLQHPGVSSMSARLLAPLRPDVDRTLLDTLHVYLVHSGATAAVCETLFIHRNTLTYRLRNIEAALGLDLQDGEMRATLLMATRTYLNGPASRL